MLGDIAYDIQGVSFGLRVIVLIEDFKTVVDGANRIDDVVADLARNQGGEFKVGRRHALVHG